MSDFSEVVTNTVNTFAAVVRNRLLSIINGGPQGEEGTESYPEFHEKIQGLVNAVIGLVPPELDIGDKGLYLDGFLYKNITTVADFYIQMRLKTMLRYEGATFDSSKCVKDLGLRVAT